MTKQLHKRFSTKEVKVLLEKYLTENVKLMYILEILKITQRLDCTPVIGQIRLE